MSIDFRKYIETKMDDLEGEKSANNLDLKLSCEKRQEIAILQNALLSHGLNDLETDNMMDEINRIITNLQNTISYLTKKLGALYHYYQSLNDAEILKAEKADIEKRYPIISII